MNQEKNQKQSENFFISLFKWKMDEEELKHQVENYNTLGFLSSARKVATALIIFSVVLTLIFVMVGWISAEVWMDIVIGLVLAVFVYKGNKWAMIITMIYWTAMKGLQVVSGFSLENFRASHIWGPIIWWAILMGALWQAYQVERERARLRNESTSQKIKTQKGFIQIPLLIIVIASIVVASAGAGVVLHKQGKLAPLVANISEVFKGTKDITTVEEEELKSGDLQVEQEPKSVRGEAIQQEASQEDEKAKAEAERLRKEAEEQKRQRELERKRAEEIERITKIKNADQELSQLISEAKQLTNRFSQEKNDANNFISTTIRSKMSEYSTYPSIQQYGQQLISETNNLSFILEKLIDIENDRIKELSSLLGSGNTTSNRLLSLESQFESYFNQYKTSDNKIKFLIETFVASEKTAAEEELRKKQEELQRQTKATQVAQQLLVKTQEIDSQLATLDNQIKEKEAKIESIKNNPWLSAAGVRAQTAKVISELNPLINQWNSLLDTRKKIVTISYKLDDYVNYGTPLSAEDRTFLWSLGISF